MKLNKQIERLEKRFPKRHLLLTEAERIAWQELLRNWPESKIRPDFELGAPETARLHPEELEEIRANCRKLAQRLESREILTIRKLLNMLPLECLKGLEATRPPEFKAPQSRQNPFPTLPRRRRWITLESDGTLGEQVELTCNSNEVGTGKPTIMSLSLYPSTIPAQAATARFK